jgi:hypothetical protein
MGSDPAATALRWTLGLAALASFLLPTFGFTSCHLRDTKGLERTVNPLFDENFELLVEGTPHEAEICPGFVIVHGCAPFSMGCHTYPAPTWGLPCSDPRPGHRHSPTDIVAGRVPLSNWGKARRLFLLLLILSTLSSTLLFVPTPRAAWKELGLQGLRGACAAAALAVFFLCRDCMRPDFDRVTLTWTTPGGLLILTATALQVPLALAGFLDRLWKIYSADLPR